MELKERITTYAQSHRLKELGFPQSIKHDDFVYSEKKQDLCLVRWSTFGKLGISNISRDYATTSQNESNFIKALDAFQVDELLPVCIEKNYYLEMNFDPRLKTFGYYYYDSEGNNLMMESSASTRIEAKINLLILLLENKMLSFS